MALLEMSLNIQETEATGRKRSHDEFAGESVKVEGSEDSKMQTSSQPEGECCAYHYVLTMAEMLTFYSSTFHRCHRQPVYPSGDTRSHRGRQ